MIQHIQKTCGLPYIRGNATKLYENNTACITQIKWGFIKSDKSILLYSWTPRERWDWCSIDSVMQ